MSLLLRDACINDIRNKLDPSLEWRDTVPVGEKVLYQFTASPGKL